jgi:hypothetical protein
VPRLESDFAPLPLEMNKLVDASTVKSETGQSGLGLSRQRYGRYFEGNNQPIKKGVFITVTNFKYVFTY